MRRSRSYWRSRRICPRNHNDTATKLDWEATSSIASRCLRLTSKRNRLRREVSSENFSLQTSLTRLHEEKCPVVTMVHQRVSRCKLPMLMKCRSKIHTLSRERLHSYQSQMLIRIHVVTTLPFDYCCFFVFGTNFLAVGAFVDGVSGSSV